MGEKKGEWADGVKYFRWRISGEARSGEFGLSRRRKMRRGILYSMENDVLVVGEVRERGVARKIVRIHLISILPTPPLI